MRVLFALELGGGLGHLGRVAPLARELARRGAHVMHALRDLQGAADAPMMVPGALLQAPVLAAGPLAQIGNPISYGEILLHSGYGNANTLGILLRAWRTLLELAQADIVVADHAPTAILAARCIGLPVVHVGDGFTIPPDEAPTRAFSGDSHGRAERLANADARVLECVNLVITSLGAPALGRVVDILRADEVVLATYAELDHYRGAARREVHSGHVEPAAAADDGWESIPAPRVFAYLKPTALDFDRVVGVLEQLPWQVKAYAGGYRRADHRHGGLGIRWSPRPLSVAAIAGSDLVVCHAGHGLTCSSLLAGKPLMLLPEMIEQQLTARNVQALGAGLSLDAGRDEKRIRRTLVRVLEDPALRAAAAGFAGKYAVDPADTTVRLAELADRVSALAIRRARA